MADIKDIIKTVNKSFKDILTQDGEIRPATVKTWVKTGSTLLDGAVKEGLPLGRVVEIVGKSGTGKSAISFAILAETQKMGGVGILLDSECAADLEFAEKFGINTEELIIAVPDTIEDIYKITKDLVVKIRETSPDNFPITVVADSCTISTQEEHEKTMDEVSKIGQNAKIQRRGLRSMLNFFSENNVLFVGINHITANIGNMYGPKEVSTGGSAWEYFPSVRIKLHGYSKILDKTTKSVLGMQVKATVFKNRHDFPFREALLIIDFNTGFDDVAALVEYGKEVGLFGSKQGWYTYKNESYRKQDLEAMFRANKTEHQELGKLCVDILKATDKKVSENEVFSESCE